MMPRSLFGRLVLVLVSGLVVAQLISIALNVRERKQIISSSRGAAWAARVADTVSLLDTLAPPARNRVTSVLSHPHYRVSMVSRPLALEHAAGDLWPGDFRKQLRGELGPGRAMQVGRTRRQAESDPGPPHARLVAEVRLNDGSWVVFSYLPWEPPRDWPRALIITLLTMVAAIIVLSLIAVRWVTRPLAVLSDAAEALGEDIGRPPLAETGPREVRLAARAFNRMQARLRENLAERSRILAAVSHDLKTPITRLRLRAEMLDEEPLKAKFIHDVEDMEQLVRATLDFMRGIDAGEARQPVDVLALVESVQRDFEETGQRVTVDGGAHATITGKARALRRCLENLITNAVNYGRDVRIVISDNPAQLELRVMDSGPGIPEEDIERVFEPYYRLERSRNRDAGGTGLGLGIARRIAQSHGGTLRLENQAQGGLVAILTLPK